MEMCFYHAVSCRRCDPGLEILIDLIPCSFPCLHMWGKKGEKKVEPSTLYTVPEHVVREGTVL